MHPVIRPHLDNTNPDQDTRRQRIQRAEGDDGAGVVPVKVIQDADADGHADGRGDGER